MDRDIPTFNRTVMERIYSKNHEMHLKRLKNIKSGISSNKSYSKPSHLTNSTSLIGPNYHSRLPQYNNLKRQSLQQMNNTKIQRQNALLFKKMIKIMKRPDKNNDPSAPRYNVTMNAAKQRMSMEFSKINEENRTLFHRLEQQKPTIDMKKLQDERMKNLNILKFLGKYPNQQAMSRVKQQQYNTFEMRSKRMSSTSNRIYYNANNANNNHLSEEHDGENIYQHGQEEEQQHYEKFRNDMEFYDKEIRELKDETKKAARSNSRTIEKFTATSSGNYYNPRQNYQQQFANKQMRLNSNNNNGYNGTNNNHPVSFPDQPLPPGRRKFLSQGGNRHTLYNNQRHNFPQINQPSYYEQESMANHEQQQPSAYPYHLNHPSSNIVIQDRLNSYYNTNSNKRRTLQNIKQKKPIQGTTKNNPNHTNLIKPNIPKPYITANPQRKLNTKNSKTNLGMGVESLPQEIQPSVRPQFNMFKNEFYHESMREQEEEYETEPSPKRLTYKNQPVNQNNSNKRNSQKNLPPHNRDKRNFSYSQDRADQKFTSSQINQFNNHVPSAQQHMILLYKTSIRLSQLLTNEEKQQLANDILAMNNSRSNKSAELKSDEMLISLNMVLSQYSASISIHRLSDCYKVSIFNITFDPHSNNNKKKRSTQQIPQSNQLKNLKTQLNPQTAQLIRSFIETYMIQIVEVEIPEQQGSLLLEQIDYNYKFFITQMVKIEKDLPQEQGESNGMFYRLAIVLKEEKQENKNEKGEIQQQNQDNVLNLQKKEQSPHLQTPSAQSSRHSEHNHSSHQIENQQNQTNLPNNQNQNNLDTDQQQTLTKPQAISSNITHQNNQPTQAHHQKSIYVQALDQQVL